MYLDEALLYHIGRVDHRHNLSPYWLQMYLGLAHLEAQKAAGVATSAIQDFTGTAAAFVPQVLMLIVVSWVLRRNAAHAVAVETMLFVAFNKVCTVQYFVWYLPLLPFLFYDPTAAAASSSSLSAPGAVSAATLDSRGRGASPLMAATARRGNAASGGSSSGGMSSMTKLGLCVAAYWVASMVYWMEINVRYELRGEDTLMHLWLCSCAFFIAQVAAAAYMCVVAKRAQRRAVETAAAEIKR
jgi:phosphatidylinositol glycan class M